MAERTKPAEAGGRPELLPRQLLLDRLSAAARVTLVVAPAGSGKSSLLRTWAAGQPAVAWSTVARGGPDAQRFWLGVVAALRATAPGARLVGAVSAAPELDAAAVADRLRVELEELEEPLALVLDDLHELRDPDALRQLEELIADGPPSLRFVLAARTDLRLGLHRLRLDGELTELRAADLRFSAADAAALLASTGAELSAPALARIVERTEGWAAGLRLAALSLAGHPDPERFAADFGGSDRVVAEYLLAEVLERQPAEVRRLLLRTSILDRVTGPLADQLTGGSSGARILDELERAGAFVVAVDPQRTTYRYHRLFADLLDRELRRSEPQELPGLHVAAAEWLAEHGDPVAAVRHAQAARDWELAARLLADRWATLWLDGRRAEGGELLRAFPPGLVAEQPELAAVAVADELSSGSLETAAQLHDAAVGALPSLPPHRRARVELTLATLALSLARQRHDPQAVADAAERLLAAGPGLDDDVRAVALVSLGIALAWSARIDAAEERLEAARALAQRRGRPMLEVGALSFLALTAGARSHELAERRAHDAIALAERHGWAEEPFAALAYAVLATLRLWRGRLADAEEQLVLAERALRTDTELATRFLLEALRARLELARGRTDAAVAAFAAAERSAKGFSAPHALAPGVRGHALLARLRDGDADGVAEALAALDETTRDAAEFRVPAALLALDRDRAEEALERVAGAPAAAGPRWNAQTLIAAAHVHAALGDAGAAARALETALDLAEPDGLLLPFLLLATPAQLEAHRRRGSAHAALIAELLSALSGRAPGPGPSEVAPLEEPLSGSELRVLRYLPTNLKAPEIAAELFVSVNTVRTHMRHIYAKLGVHQRGAAVARGRELGLLAPGAGR